MRSSSSEPDDGAGFQEVTTTCPYCGNPVVSLWVQGGGCLRTRTSTCSWRTGSFTLGAGRSRWISTRENASVILLRRITDAGTLG
jgi:hypothetical protein